MDYDRDVENSRGGALRSAPLSPITRPFQWFAEQNPAQHVATFHCCVCLLTRPRFAESSFSPGVCDVCHIKGSNLPSPLNPNKIDREEDMRVIFGQPLKYRGLTVHEQTRHTQDELKISQAERETLDTKTTQATKSHYNWQAGTARVSCKQCGSNVKDEDTDHNDICWRCNVKKDCYIQAQVEGPD